MQEKYNQLLSEKQILEKNLPKSSDATEIQLLKKEIEEFKQHTAWRPEVRGIVGPTPLSGSGSSTSTKPSVEKNFNAQIAVSDNLYEIPIKYTNNTKRSGDGLTKSSKKQSFKSDSIINSVENFQFVPKPLADALALSSSSKATTPSSNRKTSESNGNNKLNIAPNAPMPENSSRATSTTVASKKLEENSIRKHPKPLPQGVVPFLDDISVKTLDKPDAEQSKTNDNNRYQNVIDEAAAGVVDNADAKNSDNIDPMKELHNANGDKDTGAREVNDSNDFVVDEHNHHGHLDHRNDMANDAAEEDLNLYEINKHKKSIVDKQVNAIDIPNGSDDDLQVIHRANGNNDDDNHIPLNGNKLKNEVDQDQGKYPDDVHLEEQVEDEDG